MGDDELLFDVRRLIARTSQHFPVSSLKRKLSARQPAGLAKCVGSAKHCGHLINTAYIRRDSIENKMVGGPLASHEGANLFHHGLSSSRRDHLEGHSALKQVDHDVVWKSSSNMESTANKEKSIDYLRSLSVHFYIDARCLNEFKHQELSLGQGISW